MKDHSDSKVKIAQLASVIHGRKPYLIAHFLTKIVKPKFFKFAVCNPC